MRNTLYTKGVFLQILVLRKLNDSANSKFDCAVPVFTLLRLLLKRRRCQFVAHTPRALRLSSS